MKIKKKLTKKQCIDRIKSLVSSKIKVDPDFCILCPPACAADHFKNWYCPMIKGMICDVCCAFDMDADDWPRGLYPKICKDLKCSVKKKYKEANKK